MKRTLYVDEGRGPEIIPAENDIVENGDKKQNNRANTVSHYKLFSFADSFDYSLMLIGTVGAIGNGICTPLMTIFFGDLVQVMAGSIDVKDSVHEARVVSLKFMYLALASGFASFLRTSCWMITGERQAARIRALYLRAILRQDIAFFDKEASTGQIVSQLSGDTILIQDAMGDKVGNFIQLLVTAIGGFIVAFSKGWLLTFAMICTIPPVVFAGAITMMLLGKIQSQAQSSYSVAATIVEQTIGSIRTVASFSGEKRAIKEYDKALVKVYRAGLYEGLASGLGFGTLMMILFCSYAYAMWIGGKMIINKGYTGGTVINVMFAVVLGSL
ncbi:hypothetical protein CRG98_036550 [Punica granatum]|nr:hypothetical protein CRG98_036550 [Punica granatum]